MHHAVILKVENVFRYKMFVMRKLLTSLTLIFSCYLASAQNCCPYINSVTVDPNNPQTTDHIYIYTSVTTPNQGTFIHHSQTIDGDTIRLTACYWEGMATALWTYNDTYDIGLLPEGDYVILFTAQLSISDDNCIVQDSQTSITEFSVGNVAGIDDQEAMNINIYPNPVTSILTIEANAENVRMLDIDGKVISVPVVKGTVTQVDLSKLSAGSYVAEIMLNGVLTRKMIVKD
jgi:hypothetical protein